MRDDGCGMAAAELPHAFERHATSKLRELAELTRLRSYGFRGEALPSIVAATAEVECLSRTTGEALGARLCFQEGRALELERVGAPPGSTLTMRGLFARQPARRKFLAGPRSERAALARVCSEAALAQPEVAITLSVEGRTLLRSPGRAAAGGLEGARRAAFGAVWGATIGAAAIPFRGERPLAEGAWLRAVGLAAPPPHQRGRRGGVQLFVNGRPVAARRLVYAVEEAYAELLPRGRFPIAAVFLEVPGERVDVNVHPSKATVKLQDEEAAFGLIQRALREALLSETPRRGLRLPAPAGQPAAPAVSGNGEGAGAAAVSRAALRSALRGSALKAGGDGGRRAAGREGATTEAALSLPPLRLLGQLRSTFIVTEGAEGMVLVDQHAAHERVLYERLLAGADGGEAGQQPLLEPALLELTPAQAATLEAQGAGLRALGFAIEPFGERALRLRALPASLGKGGAGESEARAALLALLDDLGGGERAAAGHDAAAASAACHAAVRAGQRLTAEEMGALLGDLERCDNPHSCPHGRPTLVELAAADLLRQFGRR